MKDKEKILEEKCKDFNDHIGLKLLMGETKNITLWMEGFAATGESGTAQCLGTYKATNLDDAVRQYMEVRPNSIDWDRFGRGRHAIWSCEIFDNEEEARKSFG